MTFVFFVVVFLFTALAQNLWVAFICCGVARIARLPARGLHAEVSRAFLPATRGLLSAPPALLPGLSSWVRFSHLDQPHTAHDGFDNRSNALFPSRPPKFFTDRTEPQSDTFRLRFADMASDRTDKGVR